MDKKEGAMSLKWMNNYLEKYIKSASSKGYKYILITSADSKEIELNKDLLVIVTDKYEKDNWVLIDLRR